MGVGEESVGVRPFYCGKRSADLCVVLPEKILNVFASTPPAFSSLRVTSASVSFASQRRMTRTDS